MRRPAEGLLLSAVLSVAFHNVVAAPDATTPTPELLEFLGSFETRDGAWVDPLQFDPRTAVQTETRTTDDKAGDDHGKK